MNTEKTIVWQASAWAGTEHCKLEPEKDGFVAKSYITGSVERTPFAVAYKIELTSDWKAKRFSAWSLADVSQKIQVLSDQQGHWFDEQGKHLEEFDGCIDIDISISPFTNTLPIRRLEWYEGRKQKIEVLYVKLPEFKLQKSTQFYTNTGERRYRYQDGLTGYVGDIEVDGDGLVADYLGLFNRIYP